jgi:hypothetical protein
MLEAQAGGFDEGTLNSMNKKFLARSVDGPKAKSMKEKQASEIGEKNVRRLERARMSVLRRAGVHFWQVCSFPRLCDIP